MRTLASLLKPCIIFIWKYPCEPKSGTRARTRSESRQSAMKAMVSPQMIVPMFCTTSERVSAIILFTAAASVERRAPIEPLQSKKNYELNGMCNGYGLTSKNAEDAIYQGVTQRCHQQMPSRLTCHFRPHQTTPLHSSTTCQRLAYAGDE